LAGWQLFNSDFAGLKNSPSDPTSSASSTPSSGAAKLRIANASTLDPAPSGDGEENTDRAARAFDGDDATLWNTNIYQQQFGPGGLKKGVGLVLDLGARKEVSSVAVTLVGADTDLQVRLADNQGGALTDYTKVAASTGASGRVVLSLDKATQGRYVLIWLTKLPSVNGGYRGQISEVVIRGT
jgi:hypothetical protein